MTAKTINLYQFDELDDAGKEKAREWFREASAEENNDFDFEYRKSDFVDIMSMFGFTVKDVYYSGFWSQGDGASFTGTWRYKKGWRKDFLSAYPKSKYLEYMDAIANEARKVFYDLSVRISHSGHYQHSGCMDVDVQNNDYRNDTITNDIAIAITDNFRCIADTLYGIIEQDYDWRNADKQVDESIIANEYDFTAEGERED